MTTASSDPTGKLEDGGASVYLLHGEEPFLTRQAAGWLRERVLAGAPAEFALDRFDARDRPSMARIVEAARTLPMMAPRRLVEVKNAQILFAPRGPNVEMLVEYVSRPDPMACVAFIAEARVDKRGTLFRRIRKHGVVVESTRPRERELRGWLRARAGSVGRSLAPDAAAAVVATIGRDLGALDATFERLALFVESGPILLEHVEEVVTTSQVRTVWELTDAVADRRPADALARAHELMSQGEAPLKLLSLVARQFRQLLIGRSARARGDAPEACAAAAGVPPFRARAFAGQLGNYTGRELLDGLERVLATDRALKSSKLPDELVFESLLLALCRPRSGG